MNKIIRERVLVHPGNCLISVLKIPKKNPMKVYIKIVNATKSKSKLNFIKNKFITLKSIMSGGGWINLLTKEG